MDLFGPFINVSLGGNVYTFVILDDYSHYTQTKFLSQKRDVFSSFRKLAKVIQKEKGLSIAYIRSDHGGEFQKEEFEHFCNKNGIQNTFSTPRTSQQNGLVERKNKSLVEFARTVLNETNLHKYLWVDVVHTAWYVMNHVLI